MKQLLLFLSLLYGCLVFSQTVPAIQAKKIKPTAQDQISTPNRAFDLKKAYEEAKVKGIKSSDIEGYVQFLKDDFSSKNALTKQAHKHTPYEQGSKDFLETVIYLKPNAPQSIGCPNMGFDQYSFSGWTGGTGTVSTNPVVGGNPIYNSTGTSIINTAGNNVSVRNTINYHTLMTQPTTTNNIYPNCSSFGYDSVATRAVGSTLVSDIPFVSPYSFDPVSVRMNGAVSNYRGCRLKYITTTSANNKQLTFSYACVLQNGGHDSEESPYFKVEVINEATGTILPGCTSYTFNPVSSVPSDSLKLTASPGYNSLDPVSYRKWQLYSVDLSALPLGTSVSVNFEVGGCSLGGHLGYAYVDAECGGIATPYSNMCTGATYATLVAPQGFVTYQWFDPSNTPIGGGTNDTLIINNPTNGNIYTVQMVSPGGCMVTSTVSLVPTIVSISSLNSTSSCAGGNSGTAFVQATGSNSGYTYVWTSTSGPNAGQIVGNSQTATGLAPGTYSVAVSSTGCGLASGNLSVGVTPVLLYSQVHSFCGNTTLIPRPGGTNYQWYNGNIPILAPQGTNDTLYISPAVAGNIYKLTYINAFGCKDSLIITLNQITGGNAFISNKANTCPESSNGSITLNLNTSSPAPYTYTLKSTASTVTNTSTSSNSLTVSFLPQGTYTATINDGVCIYTNTFTIASINTNFTISTTGTVLCLPSDTAKISLTYGGNSTVSCFVDPLLCTGPPTQLFNSGPFFNNSNSSYPSPYTGYNYSGKHQFLVKASDLNSAGIAAGRISSLAFNITNMNSSATTFSNYQIKMGCSNVSEFVSSGAGPSFVTSGMQTVYSSNNQPVTTGWLTHNFTQSYVWDGISNLVVEVCNGASNTTSGNPSFQLKQMPYIANMKRITTSSGVSVCSNNTANGTGNYMANGEYMIPNMRFGFCAYTAPTSSYSVSVSPGSINHNYGNDSLKIIPPFTTPPTTNAPVVYTVTVINPVGNCVSTRTVAVLYPSLTTVITASPVQSTVCIGSPVNLSSSGAINYNWFYIQNGAPVSISTNSTITVVPPSAGTNSYIVTGTSPCPASIPDTKTVTINVLPKANLLIAPIKDWTKCLDAPYVITTGVGSATPGNLGTPYTYAWTTLPNNDPAPGNNTASSYTTNANSTSTLVLTVNGECATTAMDTVVISNLVDDLTVTILDSSKTCPNTSFTLSATASNGYGNYSFAWYMDGNPNVVSTNTTAVFISPATQGQYSISVYVNDSCGYNKADYEVIVVFPSCGIEIPNVITPNGDIANEFFKIKNLEFHPNTSVSIFDRWGKKVYENSNYNNEWRADGLSDATYFYVIDVPDDKKYSGFITVFRK